MPKIPLLLLVFRKTEAWNLLTFYPIPANIAIDFRNGGTNDCVNINPLPAPTPTLKPWPNSIIKNTNNFTVNIGPTGGDRGYSAITSESTDPKKLVL